MALTAALAAAGLTVADLQRVVITHTHIDHFGQAARLCEESEARCLIIDAGHPWLTDFSGQWQKRLDYYRDEFLPGVAMPDDFRQLMLRYSLNVLETYRSVPTARVDRLHDGERVEMGNQSWVALHTPGHASTLACFYHEETATLLSSDLVLARTPTPVVETAAAAATYGRPLPTHLKSLERVMALDITLTFPGHGAPIRDTYSLLEAQLLRIAERKAECLSHVHNGVETVFGLTQAMYAPSGSQINMAGLWMVVGYLDLLEAEGRVRRDEVEKRWVYRAISW
ncbi:MAG: MBL fold metallo-hydrolase [Caldilineaceae bacterium]|nr:MBL fold metallo-hydrolase [Caldilineaceae bacterium]